MEHMNTDDLHENYMGIHNNHIKSAFYLTSKDVIKDLNVNNKHALGQLYWTIQKIKHIFIHCKKIHEQIN